MPRGFDSNVTIKRTINALLSKITGQWKGRTAGGCANNRETWPDNPRFKLVIDSPSQIQVSCQLVYGIGDVLISTFYPFPASP